MSPRDRNEFVGRLNVENRRQEEEQKAVMNRAEQQIRAIRGKRG